MSRVRCCTPLDARIACSPRAEWSGGEIRGRTVAPYLSLSNCRDNGVGGAMDGNGAIGRKPNLIVIISSVRDGRIGLSISQWVEGPVGEHGAFDVTVVDLKETYLPLMTEPNHLSQRRYTQPKTSAWSELGEAADAVVIVMPEYHHGLVAPLANALDYLLHEWAFRPGGLAPPLVCSHRPVIDSEIPWATRATVEKPTRRSVSGRQRGSPRNDRVVASYTMDNQGSGGITPAHHLQMSDCNNGRCLCHVEETARCPNC